MKGAIGWTLLGGVVLVFGAATPMFGIDQEALMGPPASGGLLGMFNIALPPVPLFGWIVPRLVLVQGVLFIAGLAERPLARKVALGIYLLLTLITSLGIAMWLESLEADMGYAFSIEPGWRFRALIVVSALGGSAIVWWISDRISRTNVAHGVLAIALVQTLIDAPFRTYEHAAFEGIEGALFAIGESVRVLTPFVAGALVVIRPPAKWPVTLWGNTALRSWIDVVGISVAAPVLISQNGLLSLLTLTNTTASVLPLLGPIVAVTLIAAFVVWWMLRTKGPGRERTVAGLVVGMLVSILGLASFTLAYSQRTPASLSILGGDRSYEITLAADDRFRPGEAEAMVERLDGQGASAQIVRADTRRITLSIEDATEHRDAILDALRPHTLELQLIRNMEAMELEGLRYEPREFTFDGACESVERVRATRTIEGCTLALGRVDEDGYDDYGEEPREASCRLYCLEGDPIITGDDIAEAHVGIDEYSSVPNVLVTLDDAGAEVMRRTTRESIGRRLGIVLDGEVLSAPVIQSEIGERVQITLGGFRSAEEVIAEATTLADALSSDTRITSTWTVVEITER
jgi:hypothetical protein